MDNQIIMEIIEKFKNKLDDLWDLIGYLLLPKERFGDFFGYIGFLHYKAIFAKTGWTLLALEIQLVKEASKWGYKTYIRRNPDVDNAICNYLETMEAQECFTFSDKNNYITTEELDMDSLRGRLIIKSLFSVVTSVPDTLMPRAKIFMSKLIVLSADMQSNH